MLLDSFLSVLNQSSRRLSNASLILCIQFTDMMRDDYVAMKVDRTLPAILPYEENSFETMEISHEIFGREKGVDDIVSVRAIVISDEAVNWVDTDDFKFEAIKKEREKIAESIGEVQDSKNITSFKKEDVIQSILKEADVSVSSSKVSLNKILTIQLPKEIAFLSPLFRLTVDGDKPILPLRNVLNTKGIKLDFKLNKLASKDINAYSTKMYTKIGVFDINWSMDSKTGRISVKKVSLN